jgi:MFS family permease
MHRDDATPTPRGTGSPAQPGAFSALAHRNFRLFIAGQGVSIIGTWMQTTAQAWLVLTLTNSPFLLGTISVLQWVPVTLLSLVGGAFADRFPKRVVLIATQTTLMMQALILALLTWTHVIRYWHVAALAALLGLVNSIDMPTRQSFFVEMVDRKDLMNAIALNSALVNAGRVIGPAVAGLIIATAGVPVAFLLNGISFIGVLTALAAIHTPRVERRAPQPLLTHIREGLSYVRRTSDILTTLVLLAAISTFVLNFNIFIPVMARQILGGTARTFGLLMAALGAGSFIGAITLAAASRRGPTKRLIHAGAAAVSLMVLVLGIARGFYLTAALACVAGLGMITFAATSNSFVQVRVPDDLRGRVMSIYSTLFAGSSPLGALLIGGSMDLWGPRAGFIIGGSLGLLATAAVGLWVRTLPASPPNSAGQPA